MKEIIDICNECGKSVDCGSGRYINRIPDWNDIKTRKKMGKPFPKGNYICAKCEEKTCAKIPPTPGKWICEDVTMGGYFLLRNGAGKDIAEIFNEEDIPLIKSAPALLRALKKIKKLTKMDSLTISEEETNISNANNIARQAIKKAK